MLDPNFVFVGLIIQVYGMVSYLTDTLKGKTKPNRVSWFLWALAPLIAFVAELQKGVGIQSLTTFIVGFNPLLIFIASFFNKKSVWKLGKLDYTCGALSVGGLLLWAISREPNVAILFAILADGLASIPTVVKSYYEPETENYKIYLGGATATLIALLTLKDWTFAHFAFPFYIFLCCVVLVFLIVTKIGKRTR